MERGRSKTEAWTKEDDVKILRAMESGLDAKQVVEKKIAFSRAVTEEEIKKRWRDMLYDPTVSIESTKRMFDYALDSIRSSKRNPPALEEILGRTERDGNAPYAQDCASLLKQDDFLEQKLFKKERKRTREDFEAAIEKELRTLSVLKRMALKEGVMAVLVGRNVIFRLKKPEFTIGRSVRGHAVDIDLSYEGDASRISRIQAEVRIKQRGYGVWIKNVGRATFKVNSRTVQPEEVTRLPYTCLLEFESLSFLFEFYDTAILSQYGKLIIPASAEDGDQKMEGHERENSKVPPERQE